LTCRFQEAILIKATTAGEFPHAHEYIFVRLEWI
jgi:hypothetical protein